MPYRFWCIPRIYCCCLLAWIWNVSCSWYCRSAYIKLEYLKIRSHLIPPAVLGGLAVYEAISASKVFDVGLQNPPSVLTLFTDHSGYK